MHVSNRIWFAAPPHEIFDLVSDLRRWPDLLPHYRYVRVLGEQESMQRVKMAARRDFIPVSWTSLYEPDAARLRLRFRHVGGVTRGMKVEWRIEAVGSGTDVSIEHNFSPNWSFLAGPGAWFITRFFVQNIAGKTLRRFKELAEREAQVSA